MEPLINPRKVLKPTDLQYSIVLGRAAATYYGNRSRALNEFCRIDRLVRNKRRSTMPFPDELPLPVKAVHALKFYLSAKPIRTAMHAFDRAKARRRKA